jgi:2-oxoglutarate dehydrogenase E2 component (dihydrolipoamide succinyltransferase)
MAIELKVPAVGESITEVQIGSWLKGAGESVRQDEPIVQLETEKATLELPAPASGVLVKILKQSGEIAKIGEVIGYLEAAAAAAAPSAATGPAAEADRPELAAAETPSRDRVESERPGRDGHAQQRERARRPPAEPRVMPAARRLAAEQGAKVEEVAPTGPGGRVLKEDVQRHLGEPATAPPAAPEGPAEGAARPSAVAPPVVGREEEVVPMSMLRRRVAERLVQAQQSAALLTTFNEIDMSAVIALRRAHQEAFQQRYQVKLGFMSFFVKAAVEALKRVPEVNAEVRGTDMVYRNYHDVGIAVGGGRGLVVPVLRDAGRLRFAEIETAIADFAQRAQANKLALDELQGGTFTISNGGVYGSLLSTPIVNPPQSGILGLHAIQDRPVARDGQVVIRPMMYVALTYDHRIVDGREAVTFLRHVKECLEEPARILLEI